MKRNKFSKALKHLKSKKIDEKIKGLEEAAPTNNMSGVYQVTPSTGDAFRMGAGDPPRRFYPKADGTWPAGIPANAGDRYYDRVGGYYETGKGTVPANQNNTPRDLSLTYMNANGNDTSTMIRASDGMVYADLPEGTRNFILGPLITSYTQNHIGFGLDDDFTNLGYIRKDTRQFVLLGRIEGFLDGTKKANGIARTWDGTATQFTSYNSNFTLEHALWMQQRYNEGNFTANVPFNLSGGIPADRHPDDASKASGEMPGSNGGPAGGDDDNQGTPQDPPDGNPGFPPEDMGYPWGGDPEGELSFKPDLDWFKKNKKKPEGAPPDWNDMSDEEKENWINENEPEEKFNYKNGKFVPDKGNAVPDVPSTPNFPVPDEPLGDPNFPNNYDPINNPESWLPPEDPTQPQPPNFPDLDGPISGNDPDDFLLPQTPEPPNPDDFGTSRTASAAYKRALREWENEIEESQKNNPFLDTSSGVTPFRIGLNISRGLLDNAIYGNTELLFKGLDAATPNYIPSFTGAVGGPDWFKGLFKGGKLTSKGPLSIFGRDLQYFTPDFNTALKYAGEGGSIVAMPRPESVRGLKNIWKSGVSRGFDPSKGIETLVKTSDSVALEGVTQVIKIGEPGSEKALKALANKAASTNKIASKAAKFVPFLNWGIAAADVTLRVADGDYLGATLGGLNVIPGPIGWAMTGLQLGYDMAGGTEGIVEKIYKLPSGSLKEAYMPASELGLPKDKDEYIKDMIVSLHFQGVHPELLSIIANSMRRKEFSKGQKKWIDNNLEKYVRGLGSVYAGKNKGKKENKIQESFTSSQKRILREVKKPILIEASPKTTKLKGYRPNFKGKFSPQNTPDVTASKKSDDIVSAKNSSRQIWTAKDKFWKGYETTERMNIIYDNLGHGSQYFDRIVGENVRLKNKKSREVQEHLNMLAHQKAMREVYGIKEYENFIDESETFDNKINDPLFTKVAKRLKKEIDYPKKPAAKGYPNEAPPKIDPNTGMHPKFGKRYKYDKLDPISAKKMAGAPTGDPEIDANVKKASKVKEDWRSDLKNLWLGSEREDWKKKLEEGMTTTDTFSYSIPGKGDDILHKNKLDSQEMVI